MINQSIPTINHYVALIRLSHLGKDYNLIEEKAEKIIDLLDLNVVNKMSHFFTPQGATFIYVLSQSHLVFHTWPEYDVVHIDLVSCSQKTKSEFEDSVRKAFKDEEVKFLSTQSVDW